MKQYDSIKLEAARFERDAQRINLENAVIEGEKLRKEAAILDIELDTVRIMMITHIIQGYKFMQIRKKSSEKLINCSFFYRFESILLSKRSKHRNKGSSFKKLKLKKILEKTETRLKAIKKTK